MARTADAASERTPCPARCTCNKPVPGKPARAVCGRQLSRAPADTKVAAMFGRPSNTKSWTGRRRKERHLWNVRTARKPSPRNPSSSTTRNKIGLARAPPAAASSENGRA
eukprot:333756-Pyramimonas_sp.AAC.2